MDQESIYYVYLHRRGDNNEVFYVGKGKNSRAKDKRKRNKWWQNIVAKHGYTIEYVEKGMSEESAFDLEVETIKFYRENGHNLCNLTDGGDGVIGYKMTEEDKEKSRKRISTPEFRAKARAATIKSVICSNGMVFESCTAAENWLGNNHPTSSRVSSVCKRKYDSSQGYVWRFLDDCDDLREMLEKGLDAFVEWGLKESCLNPTRIVYCSNGMVFNSCREASEWLISLGYTKTQASAVSMVCNGRHKMLRGFEFSYENIFNEDNTSPHVPGSLGSLDIAPLPKLPDQNSKELHHLSSIN